MALTKRDRRPFGIECIKNDSKLPIEVELAVLEFSWNCPLNPNATQPDYGKIRIHYTPSKQVVETKSLKYYLQEFRYRDSFNEELASRICLDLAYFLQPLELSVRLEQNTRGGIANTCTVRYDSKDEAHAKILANYMPKKDFRGGWAPIRPTPVPANGKRKTA